MNSSKTLSAQIKLVVAIAVWGGSFIATKIVVGEVSPVTVVWSRFLIGLIILGWFAWRHGELAIPTRKDGLEFAFLGFMGITLHQWLQSSGLVTSEAATTAWIVSTTPVFMAVLGWLFLKEHLGLARTAGIALAALGVLLVVSKGSFGGMFNGSFGRPGDILILISAPNWAIFSVLSRPALQKHSAIKVTFYVLLFGWLLTSLQFLAGRHWVEYSQFSTTGWICIAFLGIFCSALAYIFYNDGLKALPASQVGAFLYLEPLVATLVAAVVLSEQIFLVTLAGGALILFGVWQVNRVPRRLPD
ncbi:MAG: DMT family transporter [Pelolinea sp.]|nr:DMT family transporter [Pelolinea sp.]